MQRVIASLVLMTAAAAAQPKTTGTGVALVMTKTDRYDAELTVPVNDLPVVKTEHFEYPAGAGDPLIRIPPLLLHKGKNTLHIGFAERNPKSTHDFEISLVEMGSG